MPATGDEPPVGDGDADGDEPVKEAVVGAAVGAVVGAAVGAGVVLVGQVMVVHGEFEQEVPQW
jgi:hypothetical protein